MSYTVAAVVSTAALTATEPIGDPHLRSTAAVAGYSVAGPDGEVGRVVDFLIEERSWIVRYLVTETGAWWSRAPVLIATCWADKVSWHEQTISVMLRRETIQQAPLYDPDRPVTREIEEKLFRTYERMGYWPQDGV